MSCGVQIREREDRTQCTWRGRQSACRLWGYKYPLLLKTTEPIPPFLPTSYHSTTPFPASPLQNARSYHYRPSCRHFSCSRSDAHRCRWRQWQHFQPLFHSRDSWRCHHLLIVRSPLPFHPKTTHSPLLLQPRRKPYRNAINICRSVYRSPGRRRLRTVRLSVIFTRGQITYSPPLSLPATAAAPRTYNYTVADTKSAWFFCATGTHCKSGMVFAVNPTTTETFAAFQSAAKGESSGNNNNNGYGYGYGGASGRASIGFGAVAGALTLGVLAAV